MTLELVPITTAQRHWTPVFGPYSELFLKSKTEGARALDESSMARVQSEAADILSHCVDPEGPSDTSAVLVVGYVQSGKTLSFTSVAALARDNGFGLVIVLAGVTKNLQSQSEARLTTDLGLEEMRTAWTHYSNPRGADESDIGRNLTNWSNFRRGLAQREKPAVLVTVLKHAQRIGELADLLGRL